MTRYILFSHGEFIHLDGEPSFADEQLVLVGQVGNVTICYDTLMGSEGMVRAQQLLIAPPAIEGPATVIVTNLYRTMLDPLSWGITLGLEEMKKCFKAPRDP